MHLEKRDHDFFGFAACFFHASGSCSLTNCFHDSGSPFFWSGTIFPAADDVAFGFVAHLDHDDLRPQPASGSHTSTSP